MRITLWVLLLIAACAKAPADQPEGLPGQVAVPTGTLTPTVPADAAPVASADPETARWATLAARLRAHDTRDLPDRDALAAFPDAAAGLVWIAANDPAMFVRARALDAIGVLGAPGAVVALTGTLGDPAQPSMLRAAAVIGLGRLHDAAATDALLVAVSDADLRVADEAVGVLAAVPSARDALKAVAGRPGLAPEIRARIETLP